ncbi:MAG: hypothetical protein ABIJ47_01535, partial [Candidatus Bathyarchaeota archaeon]
MSRLADSTQRVQLAYFKNFYKWYRVNGGKFAEFTPDQLIEYQKAAGNGQQYDVLDMVQRYVTQSQGTFNTKNSRYNNVRSFFVHNRAELPKDKNYTIRPTRKPVRGDLTVEEVKQVILSCDPAHQAAYMVMFQGALDQETFTYWNLNGYGPLMEQLAECEKLSPEERAIKLELPGRKHAKNKALYYTFIGADAINSLRNWLAHRPQGPGPIITNQRRKAISKSDLRHYWIHKLRRLGHVDPIKKGTRADKTGKGLHEMRDVWRSLWSKSPASSTVGEYLMGHQIDDLGYDKSFRDVEFYRREYLKAAPYLQIMTGGEAFNMVDAGEVEKLRKKVAELETRPPEGEAMQRLQAQLQAQQAVIEDMRKLMGPLIERAKEEAEKASRGPAS